MEILKIQQYIHFRLRMIVFLFPVTQTPYSGLDRLIF